MKKIFLSIGECLIEHRQHDDAQYFAGDTFNTALYLARYADGNLSVQYATAVGCDGLSEQMTAQWLAEGLDLSAVASVPDRTLGEYWITVDALGDRRFSYNRDRSAARVMLSNPAAWQQIQLALDSADTIYLSAVTLAILDERSRETLFAAIQKARLRGAQVVLDNNYRAQLWSSPQQCEEVLAEFEPLLTVALYSMDDARAMAENIELTPERLAKRCVQAGIKQGVIKAGLEGYWLFGDDAILQHCAVTAVDSLVDSTAAGDAFNAGFLYGFLQGDSPKDCGERGYRLASEVVQYPGAIIPREAMPAMR